MDNEEFWSDPERVLGKPIEPPCTYNPREMKGAPMGMFHCPECGCMVLAGLEHQPCYPGICGRGDE